MVDQFEAEKCIHAASTDNLVLMIIDNRSDNKATSRQFRWYKSREQVLKVGVKSREVAID